MRRRARRESRTPLSPAAGDVATIHEEFGWRLLAAAANGSVDLEALTELEVAWKAAETDRLLESDPAAGVLRSAWQVAEAARILRTDTAYGRELASLAEAATKKARPAADRAVGLMEKNPTSGPISLACLYAALALRDDATFVEKALSKLANAPPGSRFRRSKRPGESPLGRRARS